jgi:hypothetical protein
MFPALKYIGNQLRLITEPREVSMSCSDLVITCKILKHLRHLPRPGDYLVYLALTNGYYVLSILEDDRNFLTIKYRGEM